jgi:hypothetical protein
VTWHNFTALESSSAPYLPISSLLSNREQNTGSAAYAVARVWCPGDGGTAATVRIGMSGRGWLAVISASRPHGAVVVHDRLIFGLTASENTANVTLDAGLNLLVVKTTNTFAGDAVAIDGKRSLMFGMEGRDVPSGMGVLRRQNEGSVVLAVDVD